jgi:hypothetical protein
MPFVAMFYGESTEEYWKRSRRGGPGMHWSRSFLCSITSVLFTMSGVEVELHCIAIPDLIVGADVGGFLIETAQADVEVLLFLWDEQNLYVGLRRVVLAGDQCVFSPHQRLQGRTSHASR